MDYRRREHPRHTTGYFQVGGFRGHIRAPRNEHGNKWAEEGALATSLSGPHSPIRNRDGKLELVLGIRPNGASYLLMTDNQTHQYFQAFKNADSRGLPHRPLPASDFLSLSPIYFDNAQDLENKLKSYKQKSKNDKGRDVDNSTANAIYRLDLDSGDGKRRSDFELNRVLYHLFQGRLQCERYGLRPNATLPNRLCVLSHSVWSTQHDRRSESERLKIPKVLDVSFAEVDPTSLTVKSDSSNHFTVRENKALGSRKYMRTDGPVEELGSHDIGKRISDFLSKGDGPTILLVYDREATQHVLTTLAVRHEDVPIHAILPSAESDDRRASNSREYDHRRSRPRSRSRSPQRTRDPRQQQRRSPARDASLRLVVIDVQCLFRTMMRRPPQRLSRPFDISDVLGVYTAAQEEWGAALQARVILGCWKAMASGSAIDEQHLEWASGRGTNNNSLMNTPTPSAPGDEEYDVNDETPDFVPIKPTNAVCATAMDGYDPDEASDYDDDD